MNREYLLNFHSGAEGTLSLPSECRVTVDCYPSDEVQRAVVSFLEESLYALALAGMNLSSLDGITLALDPRKAACALQDLPHGVVPLEMSDQPETLELGRTVAVKRGAEFRFHIVLRAGVGLIALSPDPPEQTLALGCIAHEAAHVEHEGHLYKSFPESYGRALDCGDRSRQTFIKALDVWSEYAACRSSAEFRPEALEDFDQAFCLSVEESRTASLKCIANYRDGGKAIDAFREIQQVFGDTFIRAGYLLGHIHGLEMRGGDMAPSSQLLLSGDVQVSGLIARLERMLHELWLSEFAWQSLEVFVPIYDLLCEMMALHGLAFARNGDEWRIVMSDEGTNTPALRDFLFSKAKESF